jgi:hypothetical protein
MARRLRWVKVMRQVVKGDKRLDRESNKSRGKLIEVCGSVKCAERCKVQPILRAGFRCISRENSIRDIRRLEML